MNKYKTKIISIIEKFNNPITRNFAILNITFFVILILARIYEVIAVSNSHILPDKSFSLILLGMVYDFILMLIFSVIFLVPFFFLSIYNHKIALIFYISVVVLFVILYISLIQYFAITFIPLGSDLYAYSIDDIKVTVGASKGLGFTTFITLIPIIGVTVYLFLLSRKFDVPKFINISFYSLVVICSLFIDLMPDEKNYNSDREYYLVTNKVSYFIEKSYTYFTGLNDTSDEDIGLNITTEKGIAGLFYNEDYPLLRINDYNDVLGPYFNIGKQKPNLVFIIVEGLGRAFTGKGADYEGFTPFLNSLMDKSLYWENFLSTSGRTFAVLPSLFGSLPFAEEGFMELKEKMPRHLTLISLLKEKGYYTSFYYGSNIDFDAQDYFLKKQGIDFILDQNGFGPEYKKNEADKQDFTWGYSDMDLFKLSLEIINEKDKSPRLDIYLTLNTHEPFIPPDKEYYHQLFDNRLKRPQYDKKKVEKLKKYRQVFESFLYLDDAIKYFIKEYEKRKDYENTIFFITGDHRIIPIEENSKIAKFHVPFIIYSEMLKKTQKFSSVSSHFDVLPSLLAFLQKNYGMKFPEKVHWLGDGIDTTKTFRNVHSLPLKRHKNDLYEYLNDNYFISGDRLFKLHKNMYVGEIQDKDNTAKEIKVLLSQFKQINKYVCEQDKLYPLNSSEIEAEDLTNRPIPKLILKKKLSKELATNPRFLIESKISSITNPDELFEIARSEAFEKNYENARFVCEKILTKHPNYQDVRILMGRTYAWEAQFDKAKKTFNEVLRENPNHKDAISALIDVEVWSGNYETALTIVNKASGKYPDDEEFIEKKNKILSKIKKR